MFEGKVALITGSTSTGMGRSIAFTLAQKGADIVLNYGTSRRDAEADEAAAKVEAAIREMGRRVLLVKADTRKDGEVSEMVKRAETDLGKIDILVNNAGGEWNVKDYTEIEPDHWRDVVSAEIDGVFLPMKYAVPGMRERGWGRIIQLGMTRVLHLQTMKNLAPDYCLGKAARAWMTTAFGIQEFDNGITVNIIEPGLTSHMKLDEALKAAKGDLDDWRQRDKSTAHDVAEIVAFLCSDAGRFVSGSSIRLPTD
jgi:NAD(P)-dependent dehydrogenase (short-subunit alcohol dehydrogenase family)